MSTLNDNKAGLPIINSDDFETNETLGVVVKKETPMKEWLVNYVGESHSPESEEVTVEMIVETMSEEFPEFLIALAEENWLRGYRQGITDIEDGWRQAAMDAAEAETNEETPSSACVINTETDCTINPDSGDDNA